LNCKTHLKTFPEKRCDKLLSIVLKCDPLEGVLEKL
jgi:hypothetical protein